MKMSKFNWAEAVYKDTHFTWKQRIYVIIIYKQSWAVMINAITSRY
jgi:hypothetical protein